MPKFCEYCGTPLEDGVKFCPGCGHKVLLTEKVNTNYQAPKYNASTSSKPEARTEAPKKKGGCGKVLLIAVLAVAVIVGAVSYFKHSKEKKDFHQEVTQTTNSKPESASQGSNTTGTGTRVYTGQGFSEPVGVDASKGGVTLGGMKTANMKLFVGNGTFPEGTVVEAQPASKEMIEKIQRSNKFEMVVAPMDISSDQYDGSFFGTDVVLTMPLPKLVDEKDMDPGKYVFACYDEKTKQMRYLWPTDYNQEKNTMSLRMPHFSLWWSAKLTEEEEMEAFLDSYCTKIAVEKGRQKQAAAELIPYVEAKVKMLGLTQEAAKDLIQATVNTLVSKATSSYGENVDYKTGKVTDYDFQDNFAYGTGTKALTSTIRAAWDKDSDAMDGGINDLVNSTLMEVWSDYKFGERAADALFKSEYVKEFVPGTISTVTSNLGGIGSMAGRIVEGDTKGAMEELGNILQGIHPAAELGTKGAKFLALTANTAFTYWKANEVEELYQIYKNGGKFLFGNEVIAGDRETFIEYLNYSSGFTKAKGVYRFYNMDKVAEVCEKFGWSRSDYDNLDEHYKAIFEQRVEDGLMEYFELRRKQEAEAEKIKKLERICMKDMMDPNSGVLYRYNYASFFGEKSYKDYSVTNRLERLVKIREFISQYVNEEELAKTAKIEDSYNYGSLINVWVSLASEYPKQTAITKFCEYLKSKGLLKAGSAPEGSSEGEKQDESSKDELVKEESNKPKDGTDVVYGWMLAGSEIERTPNSSGSPYTDIYSASETMHRYVSSCDAPETFEYDVWYRPYEATFTATIDAPPALMKAGDSIVLHVTLNVDGKENGYYVDANASVSFDGARVYTRNMVGTGSVGIRYGSRHSSEWDYVIYIPKGRKNKQSTLTFYSCGSYTRWFYKWGVVSE